MVETKKEDKSTFDMLVDLYQLQGGSLIGKGKRTWLDSKKEIVYSDKMTTEEGKIFKKDAKLLGIMVQIEDLKREAIDHIDHVLKCERKAAATEKCEDKNETMMEKVARLKKERLAKEAKEA